MSLVHDTTVTDDTPVAPSANRPLFSQSAVLLALAWLCGVVGIHIMFSGFFLIGRKSISPQQLNTFTEWGVSLFHPERDLTIYILGCLLTFGMGLYAVSVWKRRLKPLPAQRQYSIALSHCTFTFALAMAGTVLNPLWFLLFRHLYAKVHLVLVTDTLILLLPCLTEAALFVVSFRLAQQQRLARFESLQNLLLRCIGTETEEAKPARGSAGLISWHWFDLLVPILIFVAVYIPHPDIVAGMIFQSEHFHHWDYFAMGPALGYLHGGALCTQVYSQYGAGFPWLFAVLNPIYALSYGHLIQFTDVYACLYFYGAYLFFRLLLRSKLWSAFGLVLLLYYKLFIWTVQYSLPWQLPSNTILRGPLDIWFLLALLLHHKSRKSIWLLAAGALTGLSLFFETDTGVYITFTFAVYCILWNWNASKRPFPLRQAARTLVMAGAGLLAVSTLMTGMMLASRGTALQGAFWRGWLECFTAYPGGISMMPVSEHVEGMLYGMFMLGAYLVALSFCFHRFRADTLDQKQSHDSSCDLPLVCVALYGLGTMIHFVGRSHPTNLYVGSMAFTLLVVTGLHGLAGRLRAAWLPRLSASQMRVRTVTAFCLLAALMIKHDGAISQYPNALRELYRRVKPREITWYTKEDGLDPPLKLGRAMPQWVPGSASDPVPLYPGSSVSLPESLRARMQERYWPAINEIRALTSQHKTVAILANDETWMYAASGAPLWYRYTPLYPNIITKKQLAEAENALASRPVDYVYVEARDPAFSFISWHPLFTSDTWAHLRAAARAHYTFDHLTGIYEVYRR